MELNSRNSTLDILRIVASFFIIYLHITYGTANETLIGIARLTARWAMPFFFLLSGYLFQKGLEKSPQGTFRKSFGKIFNIFLVTNIFYIPLILFLHLDLFKWNYLLYGDFLHLWFLPGLLIGFTVVYVLNLLKAKSYMSIALSLSVIIIALAGWSYAFIMGIKPAYFHLLRTLLGIPLVLIGTYFYSNSWFKKLVNLKTSVVLMTAGFILQIIEAVAIRSFANTPVTEHQFLIGTLFFSVGTFILGLTLNFKSERLSKWGKDYSLFVFLYHPMLIFIVQSKNYNSIFSGNSILLFPVVVFFLTLGIGICLDKYLHRVFLLMNGSIGIRRDIAG